MVTQADNTLVQIRKKVRRLTSSPNETSLSTSDIDEYINSFYTQDFVYAIKLNQLRSVKSIYTTANIETYSLDVNEYQGIRSPVYFEGFQGTLYKDRNQFYNVYPKYASKSTVATGDGSTVSFPFTYTSIPFLRNEVVISTVATTGDTIKVIDDGNGNLVNADNTAQNAGTINYVTGVTNLNYTTIGLVPASTEPIVSWVVQYEASKPLAMLFWNNEIKIRPVPDGVYKVEFEVYQTPTAFLSTNDSPIIYQWKDYIACGVAVKILEDRGDIEGSQSVLEIMMRQEGLVLSRQSIEEIGQRNGTIYSSNYGGPNDFGQNWGWY